MRDINRIRKFCNELASLWEIVPDWRFSQLICNVFSTLRHDPFFTEDDAMLQIFRDYFEGLNNE